ncbi:hypothetical protein FB451DRAFT_1400832 [Mycena latifolia]|nr:hypothetical protein FB451DRAFT_1400832 [Mycena latifolia]
MHIVGLACVLSLLHLASGLAAAYLYGLSGSLTGKLVQTISIGFGPLATFEKMYRMLPYVTRPGHTDTTVLSRVMIHYGTLLLLALLVWPIAAVYAYLVDKRVLLDPVAACRADAYLRWACAPLAAHRVLPFTLIATFLSAAYVLVRDSIARHGRARIPMPSPTPRPWRYRDQDVAAYLTPHVAEVWLPSPEEGSVLVEDADRKKEAKPA